MSEPSRRWVDGELALEAVASPGEVRMVWRGRSADREPGRFLMPILQELTEICRRQKARLCLDFSSLEYAQAKKWQALSFSALRTFETADGRVTVVGR